MAENNESVRRRSRRSTSNVTDNNDFVTTSEKDDLGRFANRLSLDVTNDALNLASHSVMNESHTLASPNGALNSSQIETSEEPPPTASSSSERPQSLPNTPGGSGSRLAEAPSFEECPKHQRTPVGKIRDASRTLVKWLRFKSKSINGLNERSEGVHVDPPWRLWRKSTKGRRGRDDLSKRALPPVPVGGGAAATSCGDSVDALAINDESDVSQPTPRLNSSLEGLMPGDAYIPDDDDDENIANFSTATGNIDFAASIDKVKSYGWYWGPISGEAAERLLLNEPDGSFVVRDSSDDHYIFSLTFKLNGTVRHVRIEHDQGNFSFGSFTKFKSNTIVDFIENAVEHSRSGRYLFFLHRRPVFGPMRVQLLHPVSRFKQVQSLQHLCRFVILKLVPRDLLYHLPVPKRIRDYLNTPFYYCEAIADWTDEKNLPTSSSANPSSTRTLNEVDGEALQPPSQRDSQPQPAPEAAEGSQLSETDPSATATTPPPST